MEVLITNTHVFEWICFFDPTKGSNKLRFYVLLLMYWNLFPNNSAPFYELYNITSFCVSYEILPLEDEIEPILSYSSLQTGSFILYSHNTKVNTHTCLMEIGCGLQRMVMQQLLLMVLLCLHITNLPNKMVKKHRWLIFHFFYDCTFYLNLLSAP